NQAVFFTVRASVWVCVVETCEPSPPAHWSRRRGLDIFALFDNGRDGFSCGDNRLTDGPAPFEHKCHSAFHRGGFDRHRRPLRNAHTSNRSLLGKGVIEHLTFLYLIEINRAAFTLLRKARLT